MAKAKGKSSKKMPCDDKKKGGFVPFKKGMNPAMMKKGGKKGGKKG